MPYNNNTLYFKGSDGDTLTIRGHSFDKDTYVIGVENAEYATEVHLPKERVIEFFMGFIACAEHRDDVDWLKDNDEED